MMKLLLENWNNYLKENKSDISFKKLKDLNDYQLKELNSLTDEADAHEEFSGFNLVKGQEYDSRRIVFLLGDNVVGFMTPREETRFGKNRWRTGAIFVSKNFRGMGIAPKAIKEFFKDKKGYSWISNQNKASQNAFSSAGFIKGEERNVGDSPLDQGHNWYKD